MPAEALQLLKITDDHKYEFNRRILSGLQSSDVRYRYVSVISVAGAFCSGKCFILNFFLRYLHSTYVAKNADDWLGRDDEPLEEFSRSNGEELNTTCITMWSEVFLYDSPEGVKWAIILLDTQGTFDNDSKMNDCSTIFALSTIISSIQIYNITCQIKKTDINYLELFVNYGLMADSKTKPFQNLIFLVSDWPDKKAYGMDGGEKHLTESLHNTKGSASNLRFYFDNISCYLMPSPGNAVEGEEFDGCIGELKSAFKTHLQILVPSILEPKKLVMKKLAGKHIRAGQWADYIETAMQIFSVIPPNIDDLKTENVKTILANLVDSLTTKYSEDMENEVGENGLSDMGFEMTHASTKCSLFIEFDSKSQSDYKELTEEYCGKLNDNIQKKYEVLKEMNHLYQVRYVNNIVNPFAESYSVAMRKAFTQNYRTEQMLLRVHNDMKNKVLIDLTKKELAAPNNPIYKICKELLKSQIDKEYRNILEMIKTPTPENDTPNARAEARKPSGFVGNVLDTVGKVTDTVGVVGGPVGGIAAAVGCAADVIGEHLA